MPIPDGETLDGSEKKSLKTLYEVFKGIKSHGLVSVQFLSALHLFFGGNVELSKDTITELYKNRTRIDFDKIYVLTAHINFQMKRSILANIDDQDKAVKRSN